MFDLVIRGGSVVDGLGGPASVADVAVSGGLVVGVGRDLGPARRTIDADGLAVLPGWVDVHTHYDGQATWDPALTPSSWHGVTTTVFGNCGVGFAPMRPGTERFLINLMEGVEDIPGTVLAEGIDFSWESFPDYLRALDRPMAADIGAQLPHGALRFYVMGERGADHAEVPDAHEVELMGRLVREALEAGALGFSTSRTVKHRARDGRPTPSLSALPAELGAVADAMAAAGTGVIQVNSDFEPGDFELLSAMAGRGGRPLSVLLLQVDHHPERWRETLAQIHAANRAGIRATGQVGCRPIGVIMGLETTVNPFVAHPSYREVAHLPLEERVARLRSDEGLRSRLIHEPSPAGFLFGTRDALARTFELTDPPNYEPDPARESLAARAFAEGREPTELALDLLLADEGRGLLLYPFENYTAGNLDVIREMLVDEHTICGLGDGGAHVATICDASYPTFLLAHWARDRTRGPGLPLELLVRKQTRDPAWTFGLCDRGVIAPGYRADLNVVDLAAVSVERPALVHDLPAGGRRLVQRARGYRHTFVAGVEVSSDGEATGARPGRLIRGARPAPA